MGFEPKAWKIVLGSLAISTVCLVAAELLHMPLLIVVGFLLVLAYLRALK